MSNSMSKLEFNDLKVGDEFYVKMVVTYVGLDKPYVCAELCDDPSGEGIQDSHGELVIYSTDIDSKSIDAKPLSKSQHNSRIKIEIKDLEEKLKVTKAKLR